MLRLLLHLAVCTVVSLFATTAYSQVGEYTFVGTGSLTSPNSSSKKMLRWEKSGRVLALDRESAEEKAHDSIDEFLALTYRNWIDDPESRRVVIKPALDNSTGLNRTTVSLSLTTGSSAVWERPNVMIFGAVLDSDEVTVNRFPLRVIVDNDGTETIHDGDVVTIKRGQPGEFALDLEIWSGDCFAMDAPRTFELRVMRKLIDGADDGRTPDYVSPDDSKERYLDVGRLGFVLSHNREGKLYAKWKSLSNASTPRPAIPGPGYIRQTFYLGTPNEVGFRANISISKKKDVNSVLEQMVRSEREKERKMIRKLANAGENASVFSGWIPGRQNGSNVGCSALFVISADAATADEYIRREFPAEFKGGRAFAVRTKEDAKASLRRIFSNSFPDATAGDPTLRLKRGRTVSDQIRDLPISRSK